MYRSPPNLRGSLKALTIQRMLLALTPCGASLICWWLKTLHSADSVDTSSKSVMLWATQLKTRNCYVELRGTVHCDQCLRIHPCKWPWSAPSSRISLIQYIRQDLNGVRPESDVHTGCPGQLPFKRDWQPVDSDWHCIMAETWALPLINTIWGPFKYPKWTVVTAFREAG